jgi:hypothetical protein
VEGNNYQESPTITAGKREILYKFGIGFQICTHYRLTLHPVEVKSGATLSNLHFKNLHFWQALTQKEGGTLIYAGDENQDRAQEIKVRSWREVSGF